jgi:hypothetical protein
MIEDMLGKGELDLLIQEDVGRLVRGADAELEARMTTSKIHASQNGSTAYGFQKIKKGFMKLQVKRLILPLLPVRVS